MMSLQEERNDAELYFIEYKPGNIKLNVGSYSQAVIVSLQKVVKYDNNIIKLNDINSDHLDILLKDSPEVILIGTGSKQELPIIDIIAKLANAGKSVDFMASEKACKTYNLLVNEGRNVGCIII
ncbi:Mth938-like domain-containing protein [Francisella adeliensis]|uniref:13 kDa major membrane protein n=1 Tax=Francisella adeliensis TaxID=2007306 RepID=A0A2Z4XX08_9GAMM|nr:Mth938-like domain-containing protein [Francisella adeliensis]AXA33138.1 hypothetical protein CDH04_01310 [Francisella adeliensis]MBK2085970.1 Mth938-like domain-containing protein [Francisella adeliensis]MBK2096866.1 Mth938-like domain-containing protein [Francisella adeliensis]QIW11367.1 hypothetical protein FZC43_01310 [Francisella adeliensis]QIW13242.1 hypothetical protein FZC44_01310 [Francisella adeliensis]